MRIILGTDYISCANALDVCDVDRLSARRKQHSLKFAQSIPSDTSDVELANRFSHFFSDKIQRIKQNLVHSDELDFFPFLFLTNVILHSLIFR